MSIGLTGCTPTGQNNAAQGPQVFALNFASESDYMSEMGDGNAYIDDVLPGMQAGSEGRWRADIADQSLVLKHDPNSQAARLVRAEAYLAQNLPDSAIADLTVAIQPDISKGSSNSRLPRLRLFEDEALRCLDCRLPGGVET